MIIDTHAMFNYAEKKIILKFPRFKKSYKTSFVLLLIRFNFVELILKKKKPAGILPDDFSWSI